ncbi:MAG: SAM-dependent methyltransferase [Lachnospiraceae bacterium]|nr:SAM-dependent methyltransferase [Lachnospiraceae bacterium]
MLTSNDQKKIKDILNECPDKIVISNPTSKDNEYKKAVIRKYEKGDGVSYQIERFTDKQAFHENVNVAGMCEAVFLMFPESFSQLNVFGKERQWDFKVTKKGKLLSSDRLIRKSNDTSKDNLITVNDGCKPSYNNYNRKKNYILAEGTVVPPLVDLGIFTKEGKVVNSMYDKYKQINRFLELVDDVVKNVKVKDTFNIIDFGCGKSYLTFILYYYLVELKGINATITGLDLKTDVIKKCNETAKKYHYDNLYFELGDINGYKTDKPVDMVVTLHACDTATDYALYNAISWKAGIILSVPCCQHEINAQIASDDFAILTRHGIIKERVSALMTDAIRANVLEYCGYHTQLLEFIDIAHSPKNILIRAVRHDNSSKERREKAWEEAERLCAQFNIKQTLMELVRG